MFPRIFNACNQCVSYSFGELVALWRWLGWSFSDFATEISSVVVSSEQGPRAWLKRLPAFRPSHLLLLCAQCTLPHNYLAHACFRVRVILSAEKYLYIQWCSRVVHSILCLQKLMWSLSTYCRMCTVKFENKTWEEIGESIPYPTQSCSEVLNVTWDWGTLGSLIRSCRPSG